MIENTNYFFFFGVEMSKSSTLHFSICFPVFQTPINFLNNAKRKGLQQKGCSNFVQMKLNMRGKKLAPFVLSHHRKIVNYHLSKTVVHEEKYYTNEPEFNSRVQGFCYLL